MDREVCLMEVMVVKFKLVVLGFLVDGRLFFLL